MSYKRRRKVDLFSFLWLVVIMGMFITVAYQLRLYSGTVPLPMVEQPPPASAVGG